MIPCPSLTWWVCYHYTTGGHMWGHCTDYIEINLKTYQIRSTKPEFDDNWNMPGVKFWELLLMITMRSQWNKKNQITNTYCPAAARAGAGTERADNQGKEAHWAAKVRGLGLVQNRKFFVWESEAKMRRSTCRPASSSSRSLTGCTGSGWSGAYQGISKD